MKYQWIGYADYTRVKYAAVIGEPEVMLEVYVCLDNKFHSWGTRKDTSSNWLFQTLKDPDNIIERWAVFMWIFEVSDNE